MNKFIIVLALFATISSAYVLHEVSQIKTTVTPYSQENVERVRAGIPKPYVPVRPPTIKVEVPMNQVECMQYNIYYETRNQTIEGQVSTGWVTLHRVAHKNFPDTICDVVYEANLNVRGNPKRGECQFAWYCDGLGDSPDLSNKLERNAWDRAGNIAYTMIQSCIMNVNPIKCPPDPTNGALFFRSAGIKLTDNYYVETAIVEDHTYYSIR